jgi:hypothetical protein
MKWSTIPGAKELQRRCDAKENMKTLTPQEAAIEIIKTIAEAVRSLGSVPSGHLYARVMGTLSLDAYTRVIESLKRMGLVEEKNHLLTWVGPKS